MRAPVRVSGQTPKYTTGIPERQFKAIEGWEFDSEVKVLETIAERYKNTPDIEGNIFLISERTYCNSCQGVIQQFQQQFKNIKIKQVHGWIGTKK